MIFYGDVKRFPRIYLDSSCIVIPLTAVGRPLLAYSLSPPIGTIEYHPELIVLMLLWYAAQQGPFLHRGISQISQSKVERFPRPLPPNFDVISPRTCRFLGLAVKPISLHPRQSPELFLLQIWWSSKRTIELSIADPIDILFRFRNCLWEAWIRPVARAVLNSRWTVYLAFLWNIWMHREFVGIDNADFNQELVRGFVFSWSTSTVVCVGILIQQTFEGIWIGSYRSPTTVIGRRLGRSVHSQLNQILHRRKAFLSRWVRTIGGFVDIVSIYKKLPF